MINIDQLVGMDRIPKNCVLTNRRHKSWNKVKKCWEYKSRIYRYSYRLADRNKYRKI